MQEERHIPEIEGEVWLTPAQSRHAEHVANVELHMTSAREQADVLLARTRTLVRNGVDLRNPERALDYSLDQVQDAVMAAKVVDCHCAGSAGTACLALLIEVTRRLAEMVEDRAR